jgi:hypothetical protein
MRERGKAMGSEFVGKGVNIILGPAMNMARLPQGMKSMELSRTTCAHTCIVDRWQDLGKFRR